MSATVLHQANEREDYEIQMRQRGGDPRINSHNPQNWNRADLGGLNMHVMVEKDENVSPYINIREGHRIIDPERDPNLHSAMGNFLDKLRHEEAFMRYDCRTTEDHEAHPCGEEHADEDELDPPEYQDDRLKQEQEEYLARHLQKAPIELVNNER